MLNRSHRTSHPYSIAGELKEALLLSITLINIDQFSKFFHRETHMVMRNRNNMLHGDQTYGRPCPGQNF